MRELPVLLAVMVVVGCGSESSVPESDGAQERVAEERVAEGTIRQVGSAPNAVTRIETVDGPIVVVGPLALEIARASGGVGRVYGTAFCKRCLGYDPGDEVRTGVRRWSESARRRSVSQGRKPRSRNDGW